MRRGPKSVIVVVVVVVLLLVPIYLENTTNPYKSTKSGVENVLTEYCKLNKIRKIGKIGKLGKFDYF